MEPPSGLGFAETRRRTNSRDFDKETSGPEPSIQGNLTKLVWEAGSRQVRHAFSLYANIDLFRPYFDVEPKQVRNRIIQSFLPKKPSGMSVPESDLYGPLMLIFTLCALLLYVMKSSDAVVKEGTLIGTSFFTCFGYWFFTSLAIFALCYIFSTDVSLIQIFSMLGYSLSAHCVVIALTTFFHPTHEHVFFYSLVALFGGLSCLRMVVFFAHKTHDKSHKLILLAVISALHIGFLMYLHFGYHTVVEELGNVLGGSEQQLYGGPEAPQHKIAPEALFVTPAFQNKPEEHKTAAILQTLPLQ